MRTHAQSGSNLLFAEHPVDENSGSLHQAVAPDRAHHKQPLHGGEVLAVHLVREGHVLWLLLHVITEHPPLHLAAIFRHAFKFLLEPLKVRGEDLEIVELVVMHPVERLLHLDNLAVRGLGEAKFCHDDGAVVRRDQEFSFAWSYVTQGILNLKMNEITHYISGGWVVNNLTIRSTLNFDRRYFWPQTKIN